MKIYLDKLVNSLSMALDIVEADLEETPSIIEDFSDVKYSRSRFTNHCKRVTYITLEIAKYLRLSDEIVKKLYLASLIHDIGAIDSFVNSSNNSDFIKNHCIKGAELLEFFPFYTGMSDIILYHHENWDGTGVFNLKNDDIPIESQIIRLADLISLESLNKDLLNYTPKINNWILQQRDKLFSCELADAFLDISQKEYFWFNLAHIIDFPHILDNIKPKVDILLTLSQLEDVAYIFSKIIDSKSKFTATHSLEIAKLAYDVAFDLGFSHERCTKMKIAGLLHDIGKLGIPSSILDKNGSLTNYEFNIIKSHVYYSKIILDSIDGLEEISDWACNHHEKLNGNGYPRHLKSNQMSFEARIICVCDIYQALREDRPYRKGLSVSQSFSIMNTMVLDGSLCPEALAVVYNTALKHNSK